MDTDEKKGLLQQLAFRPSRLHLLIGLRLRPIAQLQIAQGTARGQAIQYAGNILRQWCQRLDHRRQRSQIESIGSQLPTLLALAIFVLIGQAQTHIAPARGSQAGGQRIELQGKTTGGAVVIGINADIRQLYRLARGKSATQMRRMHLRHGALHSTFSPRQPKITADLSEVYLP